MKTDNFNEKSFNFFYLKIQKQSKMNIKKLNSVWKGEVKNALVG